MGKTPKKQVEIKNLKDLFIFSCYRIRQTRRYWLLPALILLMLMGFFLNIFTGYNVLPAIYSLIP